LPRHEGHLLFCAPLRVSRKAKFKPLQRKSDVKNDNEREDSDIPIRCDALGAPTDPTQPTATSLSLCFH
jgi:hypothetical protein